MFAANLLGIQKMEVEATELAEKILPDQACTCTGTSNNCGACGKRCLFTLCPRGCPVRFFCA